MSRNGPAVSSPWARRCLLAIALIPVMFTLISVPTRAATITVSNTGNDTADCGGVSAPCKTIKFALTKAANNDSINVIEGQYSEAVTVSKSVIITGVRSHPLPPPVAQTPPVVINGVGTDRVFTIAKGAAVTISNLIIQNAKSTADGAAIANLGSLTVNNSTIQNNSLGKFGHEKCAPCEGGGISNQGKMELNNVIVSGNSADGGAGGDFFNGVFIPNDIGGGIYNSGNLTVTNSTIISNLAGNTGGGIENDGTLTLITSTVSNNTGGGITNNGVFTAINSTIGLNKAAGVYDFSCNVQTTLTNVTVASNEINLSNVPLPPGSGNDAVVCTKFNSILTLQNSLIANSTLGANCAGVFVSEDFNLDSGNTCGLHKAHDLSSKNPVLGPLEGNRPTPIPIGGPEPTNTFALLPGSPAIDAGGTSTNNCPATDQRGVSRPQGNACDIGAYERIQ